MSPPVSSTSLAGAYAAFGRRLLSYAIALFRSRDIAEEAIQNVFARLAARPTLLDEAGDPAAYLFASVRREALALKEKERRFASLPQDRFLAPSATGGLSADECAEIERAVHALPEDHCEVVVLHVWSGLTYAQIGEMNGTSPRTLESRFRVAMETLRHVLGKNHE